MALKIGLVTGEYPPMEGGVGAFTKELAAGLADLGHEIHIVTSKKCRPKDHHRSIWDVKEPFDVGYAQLHPRVGRWGFPALSLVASVAIQYELDVVNLQYQAAAYNMIVPAINFLPWRLREVVPTVVTFHDLKYPYLFPKAGRLRTGVVFRLASSADGVVVTNEEDYEILRRKGFQENHLKIIPIGSNIRTVGMPPNSVAGVRERLGLRSTDILVGFFGFLNPNKGADLLLQTFTELDDRFHLIFVGGQIGSSDSAVNRESYNETLNLIGDMNFADRVHWSGFLSDSEVSAHLMAADVMVQPYRDGVSLRRGTLMAILAHGRPLITTEPRFPIPVLVHGVNVWLTPIDDVSALRDAITEVGCNQEIKTTLSAGAMKISEMFSWDLISKKSADFLGKIAGLASVKLR